MRLLPLALLLGCAPTGAGTVPATGSTTASTGASSTTFPDGITVRNGPVVQPHKIVEIDLPVASPLTLVCTLDLTSLSRGLYIVRLEDESGGVWQQRFVKR